MSLLLALIHVSVVLSCICDMAGCLCHYELRHCATISFTCPCKVFMGIATFSLHEVFAYFQRTFRRFARMTAACFAPPFLKSWPLSCTRLAYKVRTRQRVYGLRFNWWRRCLNVQEHPLWTSALLIEICNFFLIRQKRHGEKRSNFVFLKTRLHIVCLNDGLCVFIQLQKMMCGD